MLLGLVGKPNCGKSTFFKAATLAEALIANYPFATIKPNRGVGYVKVDCVDREFNVRCNPNHGFCINGKRFVPVELLDVAGLVPGASKGKGLGNQFLDDLRQADAFIHIIDSSGATNAEGKIAEGYNPCADIEFLGKELDAWYSGILNKVWKTFSKSIQTHEDVNFSEAVAKQFSGLKVDEESVKKAVLKAGLNPGKASEWSDGELMEFAHFLREISKPMILAANKCDMLSAKENIERMKEKYPEMMIIPCSADSELALREAAKSGLIEYIPGESDFRILKELSNIQKNALRKIRENVLNVYGSTGIQNVLDKAVFELLDYIAIFPAGVHKLADSKGRILPDCFLLKEGSTALDFAYHLHTDIGNNFIKAIDARTGKAVGKDYKLKHRDALEIAVR